MNIILYNNASDNTCVDKNISELTTLNCHWKDNTDVLNPILLLSHNHFSNFKNCNYVYISEFGRYYFVDNITHNVGNQIELRCSIDVLMTYKDSIKNLTVCVERQEFKRNTNIVDNELITQANNNFVCRQVGNPVNAEYQIYLTTCGGVE